MTDDFTDETKCLLAGLGELHEVHRFPDGDTEARIVCGTPPELHMTALEAYSWRERRWFTPPDGHVHDLLVGEIVRLVLERGIEQRRASLPPDPGSIHSRAEATGDRFEGKGTDRLEGIDK